MKIYKETENLVVLLPGLWMPAAVMMPLERRIRRLGFSTARFGYASARAGLQDNIATLKAFVESHPQTQVDLVGHSLGGVLALHAVTSGALRNVRRVVALGSPYVDSFAARKLARSQLGRWMLGICVPQWLECARQPLPPATEVGVIAGTARFGLGALIAPDLPLPNDGVVCAAETIVGAMKSSVQIPVSHSRMLISAQVGALVCDFLRAGDFEKTAVSHARPAA